MKKIVLVLVVVIAIVAVLLCTGVFNKKGNTSTSGGKKTSTSAKSPATVCFENKDSWEVLDKDVSGLFTTGFYFIDIDLDGTKELAVQLGGDETGNCVTKFYKIIDNELIVCDFLGESYSFALQNIEKYKSANGEEFYVNTYNIKKNDNEYSTYYDKISKGVKVDNLFHEDAVYASNGSISRTYYQVLENLDVEQYTRNFRTYFENIEKQELPCYFESFKDWKLLSPQEQQQLIEKSLDLSSNNYVNTLMSSNLKDINIDEYEKINTTLDNSVYPDDLAEFESSLGGKVTATYVTDHNSFVYIMPDSDFLDNQLYYYQNGKIIAYVREFSGIGGKVTYYFSNGSLVGIDQSKVEQDMEFKPEEAIAIIIRSESVWNKYGR